MKLKTILLLTCVLAINVFAQTYPEVTIRDIQFATVDSLNFYGAKNEEPLPSLAGDTVTVTGIVMIPPNEGANPDSIRTLHAGAPAIYLQDQNNPEWGGIMVRDTEGSTAFGVLDTGFVVKLTGVVSEFFTTSQLNIFGFEASNVIGQGARPKPVELTLDSLVQLGTSSPHYSAEKWEGVYVEIKNLKVGGEAIGRGSFTVFDDNNSGIIVGTNADLFRRLQQPLPGTNVEYVRGYIETRTNITNGWFIINPVFEDDVKYGDVSPPNITDAIRDKGVVAYAEHVVVSAKVVDSDATADVQSVTLSYKVNDADFVKIDMTLTNVTESIWSGTIPALNDSSIVQYFISATDVDNAKSTNPTDTTSAYFYFVLDRSLTIKDIQFTISNGGFSAYQNYEVTVNGIVTADTTDIQGDGSNIGPQVYIQNGTGQWSGIQIFGTEADNVRRGDDLTVTGIVNESFGITRIGNLLSGIQIVKNASGQALPEATILVTSEIGTVASGVLPAESYEGVLVKYENITIIDENTNGDAGPDEGTGGNRNFGEMLIADASGVETRVEVQDGTHDYHNFWDSSLENTGTRIQEGNTFESLTGILFFSFGNYKLVPRKNDDFVGQVTDINEEVTMPQEFELAQNYPNPFNPSTTIKYSVPNNVASNCSSSVVLRVYDVLGKEVATLVNQKQNPGNYKIQFDASALTSGIYFYTIKAGSFFQSKKMLLLK